MTFKELPKKWQQIIIFLRIASVILPVLFILYFWMTLGSLIKVMVG